MQAEVVGGKVYYAIAAPRIGVVRDRFSLYPIRNDGSSQYHTGSSDFSKWISNTDEESVSDRDQDWFEDNRQRLERMRDNYWDDWLDKSPQERAEHTLSAEDGVEEEF
jgi:hypothetical protein